MIFARNSFNQVKLVWYVTHITVKKKKEELFTLSSELPFLADLIFWVYYIVLQVAMLFLFIKIPK